VKDGEFEVKFSSKSSELSAVVFHFKFVDGEEGQEEYLKDFNFTINGADGQQLMWQACSLYCQDLQLTIPSQTVSITATREGFPSSHWEVVVECGDLDSNSEKQCDSNMTTLESKDYFTKSPLQIELAWHSASAFMNLRLYGIPKNWNGSKEALCYTVEQVDKQHAVCDKIALGSTSCFQNSCPAAVMKYTSEAYQPKNVFKDSTNETKQYWSGTERIDLNNGPDMYYVVVAYERDHVFGNFGNSYKDNKAAKPYILLKNEEASAKIQMDTENAAFHNGHGANDFWMAACISVSPTGEMRFKSSPTELFNGKMGRGFEASDWQRIMSTYCQPLQ